METRSYDAVPDRLTLLRFREVRARVGLSRSTITRLQRVGRFPAHVNVTPHIVAWVEHDIDVWVREHAGRKMVR